MIHSIGAVFGYGFVVCGWLTMNMCNDLDNNLLIAVEFSVFNIIICNNGMYSNF